jgi:YD repeat-containing protein
VKWQVRTTQSQHHRHFSRLHYAYPSRDQCQGAAAQRWLRAGFRLHHHPNGQTTSFQYDDYNRKTRETYPDTGWKSWSYNDTYNSGAYRTTVTTERSVTGTDRATVTEYRDGLGRVLRTETEPALQGLRGSSVRALQLHGQARVSAYRPARRSTDGEYDGLGRIRKVIPPDGTASSAHRVR